MPRSLAVSQSFGNDAEHRGLPGARLQVTPHRWVVRVEPASVGDVAAAFGDSQRHDPGVGIARRSKTASGRLGSVQEVGERGDGPRGRLTVRAALHEGVSHVLAAQSIPHRGVRRHQADTANSSVGRLTLVQQPVKVH